MTLDHYPKPVSLCTKQVWLFIALLLRDFVRFPMKYFQYKVHSIVLRSTKGKLFIAIVCNRLAKASLWGLGCQDQKIFHFPPIPMTSRLLAVD